MSKILITIPDELEIFIESFKEKNKIRYKEEAILSVIDRYFNDLSIIGKIRNFMEKSEEESAKEPNKLRTYEILWNDLKEKIKEIKK